VSTTGIFVLCHHIKIKWERKTHFIKRLEQIIGATCCGFAHHTKKGAMAKKATNKANKVAPPAKASTRPHGPQAMRKEVEASPPPIIPKVQKKQTHRQAMTIKKIHPPPRPVSSGVNVEELEELKDGVEIPSSTFTHSESNLDQTVFPASQGFTMQLSTCQTVP